ncbi:MAG: hypothetical protein AAGF48_14770 [Pseudomonadota bacterium]
MSGKLALCVSAIAFALVTFSSPQANAGGRYHNYGYGTTTACCCCCVTYSYCSGYVRGGRYGRAYAGYRGRGYVYPRYRYPYARGYARRQAIRNW